MPSSAIYSRGILTLHPQIHLRPTPIPLRPKYSSSATLTSTEITSGLYRLAPGTPLDYTYTYHEMKIILEGDFTISDQTGQKVEAGKGDVFYFPEGSKIKFETNEGGLAFFVGGREKGGA